MAGNDELLQSLMDEISRRQMETSGETVNGTVGESQRLRTMAQGLTLGGSDEIEAAVRSLMPGQDYSEALSFVRGKVDEYRQNNPGKAMGYEILGALIPAAVGLFTGGTSTGMSLGNFGKTSAIGAAQGGAYSFLSGTGGDAKDIWGQAFNRAQDVPQGVITGAVAGPLGLAAGAGVTRSISGIIDYANRTFGPRMGKIAERELKRIIDESGMTPDEVAARIESGEIMAEMTQSGNSTMQTIARGYYAKNTGAGRILSEGLGPRPEALRRETMDYLQNNMAGEADPNVIRQFTNDIDARKAEASADYRDVFAASPPISDDAAGQLAQAVRRAPGAVDDLNIMYRAETGNTPFFKIKDGEVTFDRNPTAQEADIIYRGIRDYAGSLYTRGSGGAGGAVKGVANQAKSVVDDAVPGIAAVRNKWSNLETAKEAFDEGRKAFAMGPDEVAMAFEAAQTKGEGALKAYRAGVMDRFRRASFTGSGKSLPRNIADENRKEGAILRIVFPGDNIEELVSKAGRAGKSQDAANHILQGSQTTVSQGRSAEIGTGMLQDALDAASGSYMGAIRLAGQVVKGMRPGLSQKDIEQVARMMVETDPAVFKKTAVGTGTTDMIARVADNVLRRIENKSSQALRLGVQPVQQGFFE